MRYTGGNGDGSVSEGLARQAWGLVYISLTHPQKAGCDLSVGVQRHVDPGDSVASCLWVKTQTPGSVKRPHQKKKKIAELRHLTLTKPLHVGLHTCIWTQHNHTQSICKPFKFWKLFQTTQARGLMPPPPSLGLSLSSHSQSTKDPFSKRSQGLNRSNSFKWLTSLLPNMVGWLVYSVLLRSGPRVRPDNSPGSALGKQYCWRLMLPLSPPPLQRRISPLPSPLSKMTTNQRGPKDGSVRSSWA